MGKGYGFENQELRVRHNTSMVKSRLVLVLSCMMLCFVIVALKAAEATVISPVSKHKRVKSTASQLARADILDRNGTIVATTLKTASAYAVPKEMINIEDAVLKLSGSINGIDSGKLLKDFERGGKFVYVKRNITPREQKIINDLGIPGIYFKRDVARIYPQGNLLSHVLGYVNVDNQGLAGIERGFDEQLSKNPETPIKLSIDVKLQNILRDELLMQYEHYKAAGAIGMIVDVKTGEIMAMVSLPDFDPNYAGTATADQKFNRATLGTYEMGSTMKPFTAAMALEGGTTTIDKTYSSAPLYLDGFTIHDYHNLHRNLSTLEIMMYSSNVGTGRIAMEVGYKAQQQFLEKIDMFKRPEIEIPEKSRAIQPRQWGVLNGVTISFGHGLTVTPVGLAKSYAALFNGGHLYPITLIKHKEKPKEIRRVFSDKTSDDMHTIFRAIVAAGTGRAANAFGYRVGGKTGTAEKIENGKYSKTKVMSSFVGAFPINDPKYLVIAIVDDPQEIVPGARPTGGKVSAPVVGNVVMRTGTILGIKPLRDDVIELGANGKPKAKENMTAQKANTDVQAVASPAEATSAAEAINSEGGSSEPTQTPAPSSAPEAPASLGPSHD